MTDVAPEISVVVPTFRSKIALPELHRRLSESLDAITTDWEVILVDDASNDGTYEVMESVHLKDQRFKLIRFARNLGQHQATLCGLQHASGRYVVTLDDDLQNPPEEIPRFLAKIEEGYDLVIGRIDGEKAHSPGRNLSSWLVQRCVGAILGKPKDLQLTAYRAMTQRAAAQIASYTGAHAYLPALMLGSVPLDRITNLTVEHHERASGASTYNLRKLVKLFSYLLINHSYVPLRLVTGLGLLLCVLSFGYGIFVTAVAVFGSSGVPGFPTLAILLSFLSGATLLGLGIIGEYVGRLVEENSRSRQFPIFEERW
ncbi:MAG: glycosyltransferase family 2 protein [Nocardioides sp.]|uniref:glycosyltransferase family 2 protein n=1 Tax=Nocardioides sp. TaxID=35761 RepID=UPI003D6A08AF